MTATMKSIARDLGVSLVTVSKVLHNHPDISQETRKRVLSRMNEVHYRPNLPARALSIVRSNLIGLIVPDLVHPFFGHVAKAISRKLGSQGFTLITSSSEGDPQIERREIEHMIARRVDALLLASTESNLDSLQKLSDMGIPFVLLDRKISGFAANHVGIDDLAAGSLATTHLIEIGCKAIAHIGGPEVSTALDRQLGYRQTLTRHGLIQPASYTMNYGSGDEAGEATGYAGMKQLLDINPRPDGVFCFNDPIAAGAIRAI